MAKSTTKRKPQQILDLEKSLNTRFIERPFQRMDLNENDNVNTFSVGDSGEIISLKLGSGANQNIAAIEKLNAIKQLSFHGVAFVNYEWISQLTSLEELELIQVNLDNLSLIGKLTQLKLFKIAFGEISDLTFLTELQSLEFLLVQRIKLNDLQFLLKMPNLSELYLGENNTHDLSPVSGLKNLKKIISWSNGILNIDFLKTLTSLEQVFLQQNLISDMRPLINHSKLQTVCLADNLITDIPVDILVNNPQLLLINTGAIGTQKENKFMIGGNPLTSPPYSVIELGMPAVYAYFDNKQKYGAEPLNEGRIILVGDGSAGKSSLVDRILYNTFDPHKKQTDGIKIEQWHLNKDNRDLRFNIWDFGGQEVQHAVHKFFFTSGCLYILVLDNRKEEEPEYWLQQIETLGGGAPVLVAFNKSDQNPVENANRKFLKDKYPNIVEFFNISCCTGIGIQDFKRALETQGAKLSTVDDQFPGNWFVIKKELEAATGDSKHYLLYNDYKEICQKQGVTDEETQKLLLRYFSFIGTVTWLGESSAHLQHLHVLNPKWITQGVYRIVTGKKTETLKGQIHINDFKELLAPLNDQDYTYDEGHYGYILGLMKKFELCYTSNDRDILIPSRFSKEPKIEYADFKGENVHIYILQFKDYLPVAIIHQFIVRNIGKAYEKNYWYEGIVIQDSDGKTLAMIQLDKQAKRIFIRVKGDNVIGLWSYIREDFSTITRRYANLPYSEQVSIRNRDIESVVEYLDLISFLKAGRSQYFHAKLGVEFSVRDLIGYFEPKEITLNKFEEGHLQTAGGEVIGGKYHPNIILNINNVLSNKNESNNQIDIQVEINIDIQLVNRLVNEVNEDANYLLGELREQNTELSKALTNAIDFANAAQTVKKKEELKGKGWSRKVKNIIETIKLGSEAVKLIPESGEAIHKIVHALTELANYFGINPPGSI